MNNYSERAAELFKQGYNCSQAVFASFCEEMNIDFETALKMSSSFGGGMGMLREVCGAVSGMFMVMGVKFGNTDPKDNISRSQHYKLIQELANSFKKRCTMLYSMIVCSPTIHGSIMQMITRQIHKIRQQVLIRNQCPNTRRACLYR